MRGAPTIMEMLRFSWAQSLKILFPFRFRPWLKVLVIVWIAGAGVQGLNVDWKAPLKAARSSSATQGSATVTPVPPAASQQGASPDASSSLAGSPVSSATSGAALAPAATPSAKAGRSKSRMKLAWIWLFTIAIMALVLAVAAFYTWLSSRFNFILLDTIVTRRSAVRESFAKHKASGNSFFGWILLYLGVSASALLLALLVLVLSAGIMKWSTVLAAPLMIFGGILVLGVIAAMIFVGTVMHDFALPVMYAEQIPAMSALNKFLENDAFAFGKVFQYLGVVLGFWLVLAALQGIVGFFLLLGGVAVGAVGAITTFLLIKAFPFVKLFIVILDGVLAVALILAAILVTGMIMLPAAIFLRVFALVYLTRLYPECDLLKFLKEDAPESLFGPA